jgi:hypothetical protein
MARDGYHIHTVLNSKALPERADEMTVVAAAVPLLRTRAGVSRLITPREPLIWALGADVYQVSNKV